MSKIYEANLAEEVSNAFAISESVERRLITRLEKLILTQIASPRKINEQWGIMFEFDSQPAWEQSDYEEKLSGAKINVIARSGKSWETTIDQIVNMRRVDEWTFELWATTVQNARRKERTDCKATAKQLAYCRSLANQSICQGGSEVYCEEEIESFTFQQASEAIKALKEEVESTKPKRPKKDCYEDRWEKITD